MKAIEKNKCFLTDIPLQTGQKFCISCDILRGDIYNSVLSSEKTTIKKNWKIL